MRVENRLSSREAKQTFRAEIRLGTKTNDDSQTILASKMQDSYFGCMRRIGVMIDYVLM
jgi:hypothetical protein